MLLQRHSAGLTASLVRVTVGRLTLATLTVWAGATSSMSTLAGVATVAAAASLTAVWFVQGRQQGSQLARLEEIISRRTGGDIEDLYIESRSNIYVREWPWFASRYEPVLWLYIVIAVVIAQVVF